MRSESRRLYFSAPAASEISSSQSCAATLRHMPLLSDTGASPSKSPHCSGRTSAVCRVPGPVASGPPPSGGLSVDDARSSLIAATPSVNQPARKLMIPTRMRGNPSSQAFWLTAMTPTSAATGPIARASAPVRDSTDTRVRRDPEQRRPKARGDQADREQAVPPVVWASAGQIADARDEGDDRPDGRHREGTPDEPRVGTGLVRAHPREPQSAANPTKGRSRLRLRSPR